MNELRAPDPTLADVGPQYVMLEPANDDGTLERAHLSPDQGDRGRCGWTFPGDLHTWLPGWLAAYIAVPCRDCWPDAPPPGHGPDVWPGADGVVEQGDLAWQTATERP